MSYILSNPLPWTAIAAPLSAAEDPLSRLDERLRVSPIREGWIARTHFLDACASAWIEGQPPTSKISSCTMRAWTFGRLPTN